MKIARPTVLVIAGSDSSGGAGIARDLRVLAEHEVNACCVITAVTAQTHQQLIGIHHVSPELVQQQIATAFAAQRIDVIKIGMLGTAETVHAVLAGLEAHQDVPLVLDPVLISSSGSNLLDREGMVALREHLLPRTTLLTPNIPEIAALLQEPMQGNEQQLIAQGQRLLQHGPQAVLIKGGHGDGVVALDLLLSTTGDVTHLTSPRLNASMRGTGCALASAIAVSLALGMPLSEACRRAKHYVFKQLTNMAMQNSSDLFDCDRTA